MSLKTFLLSCLLITAMVGVNPSHAQKIEVGNKKLPVKGEALKFNGRDAFIMLPYTKSEKTPWVWYAPTLRNLPGVEETWMFEQFLNAGIAIAGIDVGESYGSPSGTKEYDDFHKYLTTRRDFVSKPVLLARSRGGLMLYNWAVQNANKVAAIAGIYPVCNLVSYPGIERSKGAYGLDTEQMKSSLERINPVNQLKGLARNQVPILHLHGDQDRVVPMQENSSLLADRYRALGGKINLKVMKGQGHNMWTGWFQDQSLADFVIRYATQQSAHQTTGSDENTPSMQWLHFAGENGPGENQHIVFIAAEQEYRSEQSLPMLAKMLARHHGFDCTVLFSVNSDGLVDPTLPAPFKDKTRRHRIPGLHQLADADCVVWMSRFMQLTDDQLNHFYDYFDSGKPLIALRTANHGFWGAKPYVVNQRKVQLRELLGGTFLAHHGGWHREATLGIPVKEQITHPILTGVKEAWGTSDVYRCHDEKNGIPSDCLTLLLGQPMQSLERTAAPNTEKKPLPIAWTKNWKGNQNLETKIFHFTMGSAEDFADEGVRRILVNSIYWSLDMAEKIDAKRSVNPIDPYRPLKSGFNYEKLGVIPQKVDYYLTP